MKKFLWIFLFLIFLGISHAYVSVEPHIPSKIQAKEPVMIVIDFDSNEPFDVIVLFDKSFEILNWEVSNVSKPRYTFEFKEYTYKEKERKSYHWGFPPSTGHIFITIRQPESGDYQINTIITHKGGFVAKDYKISAVPILKEIKPTCGNGICEPGEDLNSCPVDCRGGRVISPPPFLSTILLLLALMLALTGFYLRYVYIEGRMEEIMAKYENVDEVQKYVMRLMKIGVSEDRIREALVRAGWKEDAELLIQEKRKEIERLFKSIPRERVFYCKKCERTFSYESAMDNMFTCPYCGEQLIAMEPQEIEKEIEKKIKKIEEEIKEVEKI